MVSTRNNRQATNFYQPSNQVAVNTQARNDQVRRNGRQQRQQAANQPQRTNNPESPEDLVARIKRENSNQAAKISTKIKKTIGVVIKGMVKREPSLLSQLLPMHPDEWRPVYRRLTDENWGANFNPEHFEPVDDHR